MREPPSIADRIGSTPLVRLARVAARGCDGPVVALLADSWDRYLSRPWLGAGA